MAMQDQRTLEEIGRGLAPAIADAAAFDGWGDAALMQASAQQNMDPDVARLAFPGGAMDMIDAWVASVDSAMVAHFADNSLAEMKIRERIRALVLFRLDAVSGQEEALRRALSIQAMPQNLAHALRLAWRSADAMWRLAGDTATDYNHYTKRTLLTGIYGATLAVFIDDQSPGKAETRAFLDRRIDGVMRFEKAKARFTAREGGFDPARFLGRLRYPQR